MTLLAIARLQEGNPIKDARNTRGKVLVVIYDESKSLRKGVSSSWKTPSYRASISPKF